MSDHRVPGTRAPLEDANARATRQRAMDARGLGPSGQYRLRCVVTSPWQPARVPADASGRARRRSRFRWRRSRRSARPLIGNRSPSVWPVREGRAESQRDPRLPRTPMADRQMSLPSSWPARQRPDIGCHLCVRQRMLVAGRGAATASPSCGYRTKSFAAAGSSRLLVAYPGRFLPLRRRRTGHVIRVGLADSRQRRK